MKMSSRLSLSLAIILFLLPMISSGFNITKMLNEYPNFSTFNDLLSQTKVASMVNSQKTITVLAVDNSAISGISGMPQELQKILLSVHVVLDYYDSAKFAEMIKNKNSTLLTTLFQTSGDAIGKQGFLNMSTESGSSIVFKSAVPEYSGSSSKLMGSVAAQPYNISVLQVSSVIVPPNLSQVNTTTNNNSTNSPSPAPSDAKAASSPPEPSSEGDYDYLAPDSPGAPAPAPASPTTTSGTSTSTTSFIGSIGGAAAAIMWSSLIWSL